MHYRFVSDDQFDALIADGALLEWAVVHGVHRYGTPRPPSCRPLPQAVRPCWRSICKERGKSRRPGPTPGSSSWRHRRGRSWYAGWSAAAPSLVPATERRLETARAEMAAQAEFDYVVVNYEIDSGG